MDNINLEDYYVTVEYLNNFTDNDINKWISKGNSAKIIKKLKNIIKSGGSFATNNYQASSTDPVQLPFIYKKGEKHIIEFAETRFIHFFPQINLVDDTTQFTELDTEKSEKQVTKRKIKEEPADNDISTNQVKKEIISPVKKKRKINDDENVNIPLISEIKLEKEVLETPPVMENKAEKRKSKKNTEISINTIAPTENNIKMDVSNMTDGLNLSSTESSQKKRKSKSKKSDIIDEIHFESENPISHEMNLEVSTTEGSEVINTKKNRKSKQRAEETNISNVNENHMKCEKTVNDGTEQIDLDCSLDQRKSTLTDNQDDAKIKQKKHKKSKRIEEETVSDVNKINVKDEDAVKIATEKMEIDSLLGEAKSHVTENQDSLKIKKKHKKSKESKEETINENHVKCEKSLINKTEGVDLDVLPDKNDSEITEKIKKKHKKSKESKDETNIDEILLKTEKLIKNEAKQTEIDNVTDKDVSLKTEKKRKKKNRKESQEFEDIHKKCQENTFSE